MSLRLRTLPDLEKQGSLAVVAPIRNTPNPVENINSFEKQEQIIFSPPKREFFLRRIPSEILDDLPESSVDPLPDDFSSTQQQKWEEDGDEEVVTQSLGSKKGFIIPDVRYYGRAITVIGSPGLLTANRSRSVDFSRRYSRYSAVNGSKNPDPAENGESLRKFSYSPTRSLVCQECSGGTLFSLYHTPTLERKTHDTSPNNSTSNENRWERTTLSPQSTFTVPPSPLKPPPHPHANKTFHCTPQLRYTPVYFGDPRLRRYSCGYSDRRASRSAVVSGLQDFCRTMLAAQTPEISSHIYTKPNKNIIPDEPKLDEHNGVHDAIEIPHQKKSAATPLRSPKMVKEVLKRMSSHPSGRDPQIIESFSDDDCSDYYVEKEALKVIDDFEKSLVEAPEPENNKSPTRDAKKPVYQLQTSVTSTKDQGLQSDNLVEEMLLSERKYEKLLPTSNNGCYPEKYMGREEIEDSKRFMSLTNDQKSRNLTTRAGSPAPPKPPRNYDSLPRGFKQSNGDSHYDAISSGIHPLFNGHSTDASNRAGSQCGSSPQQNYFVVVAIDFGTTYSGYAFSFTQDSDNIHMMRKWDGGDPGVVNQKTPTTLLLDPDEKFHSFGYAARDFYHDLEPDDSRRWLYFEKFKMTLHKTEHLSRETMIHAANGQGVSALSVFAHALRYFRKHALQELSDQSATTILNDDVRWVVTVPAIWRQPAKQFMRNAAYEAGIASPENPEQLLIALEPEAASIFCRRLRQHQLVPLVSSPQRLSMPNIKEPLEGSLEPAVIENAGTRYMVVDCGGGTVDITVHEITDENGTIKELHKATGGPYGSVGIDLEFERLLGEIFGTDFVEHFKIKKPAAFVDLMVAFEARKRNASPFKITPINIALPFSFIDYYKKTKNSSVEAAVKKYGSKEIKWSSQGMLRLEPSGMLRLFQPTLDAIRIHVERVLDTCEVGNITYLFLVGGFSESAILQKNIRDAFSDRLKVIIPQGVSLAILKGAVQFGIDPTVVSSRRSRLTYGVGVLNRFIHGSHPPDKLVVKDGVEWCADVFDKFVLADQSICVGDTVIRRYTPARSGQSCSVIHIYCSERDDVHFITDPGVKRCGTLVLDLSDQTQSAEVQQSGKREIQTIMIFGDTELKVSAMDVLTGKCVKAEVDFLNA